MRVRPGRCALLAWAASVLLVGGCTAAPAGDDADGTDAGSAPASVSAAASPSASPSASGPPPAPVELPPAGARVDYQLGGAYPPAPGVAVVTRDRTAPPAPGAYGICYVNAFQTQPDEDAWWRAQHPELLLRAAPGSSQLLVDPGWPDEHLLDTSTPEGREAVAAVEGPWLDGCARAGYRAVELDNLDSHTRSAGQLSAEDALAMASLLIARAHAAGLAVAQKNDVELAAAGRRAGFDLAVAEECQVFDECDAYTAVYGDHLIEVEYTDTGEDDGRDVLAAACAARGDRVSVVLRDRDVVPAGRPGHVSEHC